MGITWGHPNYLLAAVIGIILIPFGWWLVEFHKKRISAWIPIQFWGDLIPTYLSGRHKWIHLFLMSALIFTVIALARPMYGERMQDIEIEGSDIAIALDLSNSMYSEDVSPSRLGRAKLLIQSIIEGLGQDRLAIIGFAGSAHIAVPFTSDASYLNDMVQVLDPSIVSFQGTRIQNAIKVAEDAFVRIGNRDTPNRSIVIITDGEDFNPSEIKSTVPLFVVGVGTEEGGPIPQRDLSGNMSGYKRDNSGKVVLTKLNRKTLQSLASNTGGKYYDLSSPDIVATSILRSIVRGKLDQQKQQVKSKVERFQWPLLLAIGSLFISFVIPRRSVALFLIFLGAALGAPLNANAKPARDLESYINQNNAEKLAKEHKYDDAAASIHKSIDADDEEDWFNEGTFQGLGENKDESLKKLEKGSALAVEHGNAEIAAKSEYNRAAILLEQQKTSEALSVAAEAVEFAKQSGNQELTTQARQLFRKISEEKKNEPENKNQDDKQDQQNKKEQQKKDQKDKKDQEGKDNKKDEQSPESDKQDQQTTGKKNQYQSKSIPRETAESIMKELSEHEINTQKRMIRKNGKQEKGGNGAEKDW